MKLSGATKRAIEVAKLALNGAEDDPYFVSDVHSFSAILLRATGPKLALSGPDGVEKSGTYEAGSSLLAAFPAAVMNGSVFQTAKYPKQPTPSVPTGVYNATNVQAAEERTRGALTQTIGLLLVNLRRLFGEIRNMSEYAAEGKCIALYVMAG